jgi:hypothetical protein
VAAPSCYITSLERLFATIGPQDAEQHINGQVAAGMEHADYVTMRAPKPTLLSVGTRDFFDIRGSWDSFREVKLIYGRLGFGERVELFESDEEHGFTKARRVAVARWMKRWLKKQDEPIDEPDSSIASDSELQCTQSGQVLIDFKGESIFDLARERDQELRKERVANRVRLKPDAFRTEVKNRLGLAQWKPKRLAKKDAATTWGCYVLAGSFTVVSEPGIDIKISESQMAAPLQNGPTLVVIGAATDRMKQQSAHLPSGTGWTYGRTIMFDLPGLEAAATSAGGGNGKDTPFGRDWREAFVALSMDRPLLGLRVAAVLNVLETLSADAKAQNPAGFHLVGLGLAGPVVLHAALLDERGLIKKLAVHGSLVSWANIIEKGVSRDQLSSVLPGALKVYDLPDLAGRLAPLPLSILASVDAVGAAVPVSRVEEIYAGCTKSYGAAATFEIH